MRQMNGVLEFVDTADFTSMGGGEHFMCTDVEWDPTGWFFFIYLFLISFVSGLCHLELFFQADM